MNCASFSCADRTLCHTLSAKWRSLIFLYLKTMNFIITLIIIIINVVPYYSRCRDRTLTILITLIIPNQCVIFLS